ncbi:holo-ACP synthase [Candidatus Pelagibacter sp.]|nr:holo-ACP synthase [Candidatus Pelagibacter sp.]
MQILGIGVDMIANLRIKKSIKNINFLNRIFTKSEILNSKKKNNPVAFLSKRFAAKEAFSKALGTGFRNGLSFTDISITNNKIGKPSIKLNKKITTMIKKKFRVKNIYIFLSISDEKKHSIAFVIIGQK